MYTYQVMDSNGNISTVSTDIPPDQYAARLPVGSSIVSEGNSSFQTIASQWLAIATQAINSSVNPPVPQSSVYPSLSAVVNRNSDFLKGVLIAGLAVAAVVVASKWL